MVDLFAMSVSVNKVKGSASEWAFLELVDSSNIQGSLIGNDKNHSQKNSSVFITCAERTSVYLLDKPGAIITQWLVGRYPLFFHSFRICDVDFYVGVIPLIIEASIIV